ncbi:MAG: glycosyltransferase [Candidatus Aminicenantaceae bacterium]
MEKETLPFNLEPLSRPEYRVSVILPVFSETDNVRDIVTFLENSIQDCLEEIIIILSPYSTSQSKKVCEELARQYGNVLVHTQICNPGLGYAEREGYELMRGNLMLRIDSDGEMEKETALRMLDEMERTNSALVVASRWIPGGGFSEYNPLKYVLNWGFQQIFRVLYRTHVHDLTYGFKLMRAELAKNIDWEGTLHEIACETTFKPIRLGLKVSEVPTKWEARVQGTSKNTLIGTFRYVSMAINILIKGVKTKSH